MSNLDNLITKILNDCENESKRIIDVAHTEALEVIRKSTEAAKKEEELLLSDAEGEAKKAAEQILLRKKLEIRDEHLSAKHEIINKVFEHALKELNDMPKNEYIEYLHDNLLTLSKDSTPSNDVLPLNGDMPLENNMLFTNDTLFINGGEVILPIKYGIDEDEFYSLFQNDQMADIKLYKGERNINGGFILIKDGIEYNRTFEMLIKYYRHELESDIIKILF